MYLISHMVSWVFCSPYRGFVLCMETNMIIALVCALNKWNHAQRRFPGHQEFTTSAFITTSTEKEHAKTHTLCQLESLKLHRMRSYIIEDGVYCNMQMDSSVAWYERKISERKRNPAKWLYCLLRFKWRNKGVLKGSLSIFNHLSITLSVQAHVFRWVCECIFLTSSSFFFYVPVKTIS